MHFCYHNTGITDKKSLLKPVLSLPEKKPIRQDFFVFLGFPENPGD